MAEQYEPFASFAQWSTRAGQRLFDVADRAFSSLASTIARAPNADVVLANKQSLLQAALHTGAVEGIHRMNRGVTVHQESAATIAQAAERLDDLVRSDVAAIVPSIDVPPHISVRIGEVSSGRAGAEFVPHLKKHVAVNVAKVGGRRPARTYVAVMVRDDAGADAQGSDVLGIDAMPVMRNLRFKLADVHPEITKSVRNRVVAFVERAIREAIANA